MFSYFQWLFVYIQATPKPTVQVYHFVSYEGFFTLACSDPCWKSHSSNPCWFHNISTVKIRSSFTLPDAKSASFATLGNSLHGIKTPNPIKVGCDTDRTFYAGQRRNEVLSWEKGRRTFVQQILFVVWKMPKAVRKSVQKLSLWSRRAENSMELCMFLFTTWLRGFSQVGVFLPHLKLNTFFIFLSSNISSGPKG